MCSTRRAIVFNLELLRAIFLIHCPTAYTQYAYETRSTFITLPFTFIHPFILQHAGEGE